jgi:hypothetical protein
MMASLIPFAVSAAETFSCAGATVTFEYTESAESQRSISIFMDATLTVSRGSKVTVLRYNDNIDFFGAECRETPYRRPFIVFQTYCGGSGCKDLDNFGIVDPADLRVLLEPNDSNRKDAARIFGADVSPIDVNNMLSLRTRKKLGE